VPQKPMPKNSTVGALYKYIRIYLYACLKSIARRYHIFALYDLIFELKNCPLEGKWLRHLFLLWQLTKNFTRFWRLPYPKLKIEN